MRSRARRRGSHLLLAAAAALALAGPVHASQIWDGTGANDNLNTKENWSDDVLPNFAAVLQFAGTTRLTPNQDLANRTIGGFQFNNGAGTFTIGGQNMVLSTGITNLSGVTQTVNVNMNLGTSPHDFTATSGDIIVNGILSGTTGIARTPTTGTPAGTVFFTANNQHAGGIQANTSGSVALGNDGAVGSGILLFNGGSVRASDGDRTISNSLSLLSNSTIGGALVLTFTGKLTNTAAGDRQITVNNSALTTFGAIDLSGTGTSRKVTFAGTGAIDVTGVIADGSTATLSSLTYSGSNTLRLLNAASTYRGPTTIQLGSTIAAVDLSTGGNSSIGASTNVATSLVLNGGTMKYIGTAAATVDRVYTLGTDGGTIDASGGGALTWNPSLAPAFTLATQARTFGLTGTSLHDNTYAGVIANGNTGGVTTFVKSGAGTWILSNTNTYTGPTHINDGTLLVTGSTHASSTVNLNKGTLGGNGNGSTTGKIGGTVNVGDGVLTATQRDAKLAPGAGLGTLHVANLNFASDGILDLQLDGTSASSGDQVIVSGSVALGNQAALNVSYLTGALADGQKYFVLVNNGIGGVGGNFAGLVDANGSLSSDDPIVTQVGNLGLLISYTGNFGTGDLTGGNDIVLYSAAVPEPGSLAGMSAAALFLLRRRRRPA